MAWMKLDDKFHSSRKVNSIPKRHRFQAVGLWAIAGSWVAGEQTDGFVPDYMIEQWGPTAITVESLVNAGLWERVRDGFAFCSWLEYNPSKAQTKAEREASAQRMKASRERKRTNNAGQSNEGANVAPQHGETLQRNTSDVLQRPDPTRPLFLTEQRVRRASAPTTPPSSRPSGPPIRARKRSGRHGRHGAKRSSGQPRSRSRPGHAGTQTTRTGRSGSPSTEPHGSTRTAGRTSHYRVRPGVATRTTAGLRRRAMTPPTGCVHQRNRTTSTPRLCS